MNKAQLIDALAERLGDRRTAAAAVDGVVDVIVRTVNKGERVNITGFGVFEKRARAARTARNPRTGEAVRVKKTNVPAFRAGSTFRDVVSGAKKLPKAVAGTVAGTAATAGVAAARTAKQTASSAARTAAGVATKATDTATGVATGVVSKAADTALTAAGKAMPAKAATTKASTAKPAAAKAKTTATKTSTAKASAAKKSASKRASTGTTRSAKTTKK